MSRRWGSRRSWSSAASRSSSRCTRRVSPSSSSSRTPTCPCRSPTAATCSRQGESSSPTKPGSSCETRTSGRRTLEGRTRIDPHLYEGVSGLTGGAPEPVSRPRESGPLPDRVRHRFPIFERLVYINSCSQGALSDAVRQAYEDYLRDWDEHGAPWEYWVERGEAARGAFARLIGAEPDEVAVTTSLSAGLSALASGLRYAKRSKIVTTELEFPTIGQIWHAQEARGARVVHVQPSETGIVPLERFQQEIDEDTLLVSITHVSYRTGAMLDVKPIVDLAHERGALVLLDAYQSAGSVPIDV